jgi:hypothetical protein
VPARQVYVSAGRKRPGTTRATPLPLVRRPLASVFRPLSVLHWAGPDHGDKQMLDHVRFMRELVGLRCQHPALRGQGFRVDD